MPDRSAYESALLTHAPSGWDENDIGIAADDLEGEWDDLDRDLIAHSLWQMGAGLDHPGCRYGGPEPADGDYENSCGPCQDYLLGVADAVLAEMATQSADSSHDRDRLGICRRCGQGLTARDIVDGEKPCSG